MKIIKLLISIIILSFYSPANSDDTSFNLWLKDFKVYALKKGISEVTFNKSMSNVAYLPRVIKYDRFQPEFYEDTKTYISKRTSKKKVNVDTDIGLLIESLFILPFALLGFYLLYQNGQNYFSFNNIPLMFILMLAGPMTVIPLFLYVRGVELSGLGPTGMIFYITPTFQFLLGFFYYNETFSLDKSLSFILIWIAVIIYLKDLYENN